MHLYREYIRGIYTVNYILFVTEAGKRKNKASDCKVIEARLIRDFFGTIPCIFLQRKIYIGEVLLTPAPLSMNHARGTMNKRPKLKTQKCTPQNQ